jgi:hypothetical protein
LKQCSPELVSSLLVFCFECDKRGLHIIWFDA